MSIKSFSQWLGESEQAVERYRAEEPNIKQGVSELFDSNPELASIGTPEQYSQYLDTIFPDSQVKDIVYKGGNGGNATGDGSSTSTSGGGGGGAGSSANGGNGGTPTAGTGGTGNAEGGNGGTGSSVGSNGQVGNVSGGGAAGARGDGSVTRPGASGARGLVKLTY